MKGSGNDIFFRNPLNLEENLFVAISSPSSTKYASVADLGTPDDVAKRVLDQYLNEFMSTRIGVRRESEVVSASERTSADGTLFYDVKVRIKSYATKNQYGLTEDDRPQVLEWDRVLLSSLGVDNQRLYELRMQTPAKSIEADADTLDVIQKSFKLIEVVEADF